jgi:hypothetical protein
VKGGSSATDPVDNSGLRFTLVDIKPILVTTQGQNL